MSNSIPSSPPEIISRRAARTVPPRTLWPVLLFAMALPTPLAWIYFVALAKPAGTTEKPSFLALTAYALSKVVQFGLPLLWVIAIEKRRLQLSRPRWKGLCVGIGFGLLVLAAALILYNIGLRNTAMLATAREKVLTRLESFHVDSPAGYILLALFLACMHSLMEEYYWRWFVFGELRTLVSVPAAVIASSLAFMAHHVIILWVYFPNHFGSAVIPFSLGVASGGAVWAWLYQRTGTLYAAWLSHMLVDVAILAVGYEMVFGR